MHSFATIEEFARFKTATFYTLKEENAALSETDDFLKRMREESDFRSQVNRLLRLIENIGNHKEGAVYDLFRQERLCIALPPKGRYQGEIDLRLYCFWVSERIVILFNGGLKTANKAQDCPNVSHHFYNAQGWARQLIEIGIESEGQTITNIEELYIKY